MKAEVLDVNRIGDKGELLPLAYLVGWDFSMAEKSSQYCQKIVERTDQVIAAYELADLYPNVVAGYEYQAAVKLCESGASEKGIYDRIEKYVQMIVKLYQDEIKVHADAEWCEYEGNLSYCAQWHL